MEHPRAAYIEGKRSGEAIVNAWRAGGVQATSARVCLAYGPGVKADDDRALNQIIRRAITERKVVLRDQGYAIRAYCYVSDTVEMLLNILLRGTQAVYNVGCPAATSIFVVAGLVGYIEGVKMVTGVADKGDPAAPNEVRLDIGRYEAEFGKHGFVTLDEGLRRSIEWHREMMG